MKIFLIGIAIFFGLVSLGTFVVLFVDPGTMILNEYKKPLNFFAIGSPGYLSMLLLINSLSSGLIAIALLLKKWRYVVVVVIASASLQVIANSLDICCHVQDEKDLFRIEWMSYVGVMTSIIYIAWAANGMRRSASALK